MTNFFVPSPAGTDLPLVVDSARPLFIVGRNGTGKSALMNHLRQKYLENSIYLPGSRTALFEAESLTLTPHNRKELVENLKYYDSKIDSRWRNQTANQRNEKAIHDLMISENQYKTDCANAISANLDPIETKAAIAKLQAKESPLDKVNHILERSNISARMLIADSELKAKIGNNIFSYAKMSDGERIALIMISEVISAKPGILFLIDEPELHLHRQIIIPLISTLIKSRSDCEFIISTHELDLPSAVTNSRVCIVRSMTWGGDGQVQNWDFDVVDRADDLPEGHAVDIIGARRRVLFTEGDQASLDVAIYSALFPNVSIRPKGSCKEVQQAVAGVRSTLRLHHTEAFGLIDNDGMSKQTVSEFNAENIYPLSCFSVESIYYDIDVLMAIAVRQAATYAADEDKQAELVADFMSKIVLHGIAAAAKQGTAEYLAGRLAERQVRDALLAQLPKREELVAAATSTIAISAQSPYPAEIARFQNMLAAKDLYGIIARYPVRHSGILNAVAKAIGFQGRTDYEMAAVARISSDETLRHKLLVKLDPLSTALNG